MSKTQSKKQCASAKHSRDHLYDQRLGIISWELFSMVFWGLSHHSGQVYISVDVREIVMAFSNWWRKHGFNPANIESFKIEHLFTRKKKVIFHIMMKSWEYLRRISRKITVSTYGALREDHLVLLFKHGTFTWCICRNKVESDITIASFWPEIRPKKPEMLQTS